MQRTIRKDGYALIKVVGHRKADKWGWVVEHIVVMEQKLGRPLAKGELVHHIDGVRSNNNPDNLMIVTRATHQKYHADSRRQCQYKKQSSFRGVAKRKDRPSPWFANIKVNGINHKSKCFEKEEDAAKAYDELVRQYLPGGKTNFPNTQI